MPRGHPGIVGVDKPGVRHEIGRSTPHAQAVLAVGGLTVHALLVDAGLDRLERSGRLGWCCSFLEHSTPLATSVSPCNHNQHDCLAETRGFGPCDAMEIQTETLPGARSAFKTR